VVQVINKQEGYTVRSQILLLTQPESSRGIALLKDVNKLY